LSAGGAGARELPHAGAGNLRRRRAEGAARARGAPQVYTKTQAWGLTEYDRVVFLDADQLACLLPRPRPVPRRGAVLRRLRAPKPETRARPARVRPAAARRRRWCRVCITLLLLVL